jgi:prophage maintenance system killer protein
MKNGYEFIVPEETLFEMSISVAKGTIDEQELASWLKKNSYVVHDHQ